MPKLTKKTAECVQHRPHEAIRPASAGLGDVFEPQRKKFCKARVRHGDMILGISPQYFPRRFIDRARRFLVCMNGPQSD